MISQPKLDELNDRSREVFRRVVESYLLTGEPVGSRTLLRDMSQKVSAATIRNVMQDLEGLGLLDAPHVSAGRRPTQQGLRLFVDGLMEVDPVAPTDRARIEQTLGGDAPDVSTMLDRVGSALSALTHGASLVLTPKVTPACRMASATTGGISPRRPGFRRCSASELNSPWTMTTASSRRFATAARTRSMTPDSRSYGVSSTSPRR